MEEEKEFNLKEKPQYRVDFCEHEPMIDGCSCSCGLAIRVEDVEEFIRQLKDLFTDNKEANDIKKEIEKLSGGL